METVSRLNLKELKPEDREVLELFTEPKYRCCFDGKDPYKIPNTPIVAVGAPNVGLALASIHTEMNFAIIHSLETKNGTEKEYHAIFDVLEKELVQAKAYTASFRFYDEGKKSNVLWKVLKERQWSEPELHTIKYFLGYTFNPPWLNKTSPFPKGFTEFPWKRLKPKDKLELMHRVEQLRVPTYVSPFGEDEKIIEPLNSFGLRHKKKVIGWMVTHRVAPDTISYAFLYIEPEYKYKGYAIRLLADAINIQKRSKVTHAVFEINIDQSDPAWLMFIERRLAPYAEDVAKIYNSWKTLKEI